MSVREFEIDDLFAFVAHWRPLLFLPLLLTRSLLASRADCRRRRKPNDEDEARAECIIGRFEFLGEETRRTQLPSLAIYRDCCLVSSQNSA